MEGFIQVFGTRRGCIEWTGTRDLHKCCTVDFLELSARPQGIGTTSIQPVPFLAHDTRARDIHGSHQCKDLDSNKREGVLKESKRRKVRFK
jgi:hypothetical protein